MGMPPSPRFAGLFLTRVLVQKPRWSTLVAGVSLLLLRVPFLVAPGGLLPLWCLGFPICKMK